MTIHYCDICRRNLSDRLENMVTHRTFTVEVHSAVFPERVEMTMCADCKETLYYLLANPALLKKHVRDMELHNRIRYLFKLGIKEDT